MVDEVFEQNRKRLEKYANEKDTIYKTNARPSQKLCKPPKWCKIGAPNWRYYYEQQKEQKP